MDIQKILIDHKKWLVGAEGGKLANLERANLRRANLRRANLQGAAGNGLELKSVFIFEEYSACYTKNVLQIGCQSHPIDKWWYFDDEAIFSMDGEKALVFWKKNKDLIRKIIESSPAK